jgi:hypothetical protein
MKKTLHWLFLGCLGFLAYVYLQPRFLRGKPVTEQSQPSESKSPPQQAEPWVIMRGPLADYVQQGPSNAATEPSAHGPVPAAHYDDSPAGTSHNVVRRTFTLKNIAKFSFEIPAHATNPRLSGSYQSSLQQKGSASSTESADVEFLVMKEQQYAQLLRGRPADVLFLTQSSHNRQVQFDLPATLDQPARYCLVFRDRSSGSAEKTIHAEFRVDF